MSGDVAATWEAIADYRFRAANLKAAIAAELDASAAHELAAADTGSARSLLHESERRMKEAILSEVGLL